MAKKSLTYAGKDQLVNKGEKIMSDLIHLAHMCKKKGVDLSLAHQDVQQKLRYVISRLENTPAS